MLADPLCWYSGWGKEWNTLVSKHRTGWLFNSLSSWKFRNSAECYMIGKEKGEERDLRESWGRWQWGLILKLCLQSNYSVQTGLVSLFGGLWDRGSWLRSWGGKLNPSSWNDHYCTQQALHRCWQNWVQRKTDPDQTDRGWAAADVWVCQKR